MVQQIFLQGTTPEALTQLINEGVKTQLQDFIKNFKPKEQDELLTRSETAKFLKCNLSTIHNHCRSGKLNPLGLGNRVYFRMSDLQKSLIPLNV
jgi:hypothetical protein